MHRKGDLTSEVTEIAKDKSWKIKKMVILGQQIHTLKSAKMSTLHSKMSEDKKSTKVCNIEIICSTRDIAIGNDGPPYFDTSAIKKSQSRPPIFYKFTVVHT